MSLEAFWDAVRALKRERTGEGLLQSEVDSLNALIATWEPCGPDKVCQLADGGKFFGAVRASFGGLGQEQVEGFNHLLKAMGDAGWPIAWAAYGLATAWHETAFTMQPVEEAYWVKNADAWRRRNLSYYPWHGRGYVQLTHQFNYRRADEKLGLNGALMADPKVAMNCEVAAKILVRGMTEGWFTTHKLADTLPNGPATRAQFKASRPIINGRDKDDEIAELAVKFQTALALGVWA